MKVFINAKNRAVRGDREGDSWRIKNYSGEIVVRRFRSANLSEAVDLPAGKYVVWCGCSDVYDSRSFHTLSVRSEFRPLLDFCELADHIQEFFTLEKDRTDVRYFEWRGNFYPTIVFGEDMSGHLSVDVNETLMATLKDNPEGVKGLELACCYIEPC